MILNTGSIPLRIQIVAFLGSAVLLFAIIQLIRRGHLKEGYSIIWFLIGIGTVFLTLFPLLLDKVSSLIGVSYAPATLFLLLVGGLFILALHFSVLISHQDRKMRNMAQEIAIFKAEMRSSIRNTKEL